MADPRRKPGTKKVYAEERRAWLTSHEAGEASIPQLARKSGRNPRTIRTQLRRAMEERERAQAHTELYRQALGQHNDGLLGVAGSLRDAIVLPSVEPVFLLARFEGEGAAYTPFRLERSENGVRFGVLPFDNEDRSRLFELLREHLPRERQIWSAVDGWVDLLGSFLVDAYQMGDAAGSQALARTGMAFRRPGGSGTGIDSSYVSWVCRIAFETRADILAPELSARTLTIAGQELRFDGSVLASSEQRSALEKASAVFETLRHELGRCDEAIRMVNRWNALGDLITPLRRRLGDLVLSGFVPGQCSVCQVLGR